MTLALQWGFYYPPPLTQGFVYFDAVTAYTRSYSGNVTSHPIDGGGLISDHFTRDNPEITISAVISAVDISTNSTTITDYDGNSPTNYKSPKDSVKVSNDVSKFYSLLPDTIGSYFKPQNPTISIAPQSPDTIEAIKDLFISLFKDKVELVKLFEYDKANLRKKPIENLVMTSFSMTETPETGNALQCEITLKQVTFTSTQKTQLPKFVTEALAKASEDEVTNGKADSTPTEGVPPLLQRSPLKTIFVSGKEVVVGATEFLLKK